MVKYNQPEVRCLQCEQPIRGEFKETEPSLSSPEPRPVCLNCWPEYVAAGIAENDARRRRLARQAGQDSRPNARPNARANARANARTNVRPNVRTNACFGVHWHQDRPFDAPPGLFGAERKANPRRLLNPLTSEGWITARFAAFGPGSRRGFWELREIDSSIPPAGIMNELRARLRDALNAWLDTSQAQDGTTVTVTLGHDVTQHVVVVDSEDLARLDPPWDPNVRTNRYR